MSTSPPPNARSLDTGTGSINVTKVSVHQLNIPDAIKYIHPHLHFVNVTQHPV